MRHFLRFIDLDDTFDNYGFRVKVGLFRFTPVFTSLTENACQRGAAFKLTEKPEGSMYYIDHKWIT